MECCCQLWIYRASWARDTMEAIALIASVVNVIPAILNKNNSTLQVYPFTSIPPPGRCAFKTWWYIRWCPCMPRLSGVEDVTLLLGIPEVQRVKNGVGYGTIIGRGFSCPDNRLHGEVSSERLFFSELDGLQTNMQQIGNEPLFGFWTLDHFILLLR